MPYPNEHSARVRDPGDFKPDSFRRMKRKSDGKTFYIIVGRPKGKAKTATQAYRYPKADWTVATARYHGEAHGAKSFEVATGTKAASRIILDAGSKQGFVLAEKGDHQYRKDLISIGQYRARGGPDLKDNVPLDVTDERLQRWCDAFKRMRGQGVDVPILKDHEFAKRDTRGRVTDTDLLLGYLTDLFVQGDTLQGTCSFSGDDTAQTALRVGRVSIGVVDDFIDGGENQYGEVIEHVSVTPRPAYPNREGFVRVAAGRIPFFTKEVQTMNELTDFLLQLGETLKLENLAPDDALERVGKVWGEVQKQSEEAKGQTVTLTAEIETLKKSLDELKAKGDKTEKKPTLDADTEAVLTEGAETRMESLITNGNLTPAAAKAVAACTLSGGQKAWWLSRTISGADRSPINQLLDALAQNNPVELREKTGPQRRVLSRDGDDGAEQKKLEALGSAMAKTANRAFGD